jgi:ADP-heptose:LPS heptosyltransferase
VIKSGVFRVKTGEFYDKTVELKQKHILKNCLEITAELGCRATDEKETFFVPERERQNGEEFLRKNGLENNSFVVMHPGAKWPPKRWPAEYYARLIDLFSAEEGLKTVLVGVSSDGDLLKTVTEKSGISGTVLACGLGLGELASVIAGARIFIGNDSGPAHIAAAAGTPSVLLFGPTDPETCAPMSGNTTVLQDKVSCWPCTLYFRRDRCETGTNVCLKRIKPEKVLEASKVLLKGRYE